MANLKFLTTVSSRLSKVPIKDGQLIFVNDVETIYLDFNSIRVPYNIIKTLPTEQDRKDLTDLKLGFYFVEETCILWRWNNRWMQITTGNEDKMIFAEDIDDLPVKGKEGILYITDDANYIWKDSISDYFIVANKTEWKGI